MQIKESINVLVLEDDELDFKVLVRHLSTCRNPEYKLRRAVTIEDAKRIINTIEIDVALVDYRLTGGTYGLDFVKSLGGREANFPMIILTGMDSTDLDKQAIFSGAYDYIEKLSMSRDLIDRSIRFSISSHQYEQKLRKMVTKAEEQATINHNMLSIVSHEMKAPVRSVIDYCNRLMKKSPAQNSHQEIASMKSAAIHLEAFLQNLSEFVRLDNDSAKPNKFAFDLKSMIIDTIAFFAPFAEHKDITLIQDIIIRDENYLGDSLRIRQILMNLLKNAITYSDQGAVKVTVRINNEMLFVEVKDQGIGIPKAKLDMLLDNAFIQPAPDYSFEGGLGIGLTISKQLLNLLGGTLILESTPAVGTTAKFFVPIEKANQVEAA